MAKNTEGIAAAQKELGGVCQSCHMKYRERSDSSRGQSSARSCSSSRACSAGSSSAVGPRRRDCSTARPTNRDTPNPATSATSTGVPQRMAPVGVRVGSARMPSPYDRTRSAMTASADVPLAICELISARKANAWGEGQSASVPAGPEERRARKSGLIGERMTTMRRDRSALLTEDSHINAAVHTRWRRSVAAQLCPTARKCPDIPVQHAQGRIRSLSVPSGEPQGSKRRTRGIYLREFILGGQRDS